MEKVVSGLSTGKCKHKFEVVKYHEKGRGVISRQPIWKGEYVLEYKSKEVYKRSGMDDHIHQYDLTGEGSYIMEVQTKEGWYCLDATRRMGSLGRLLNHSANPNLKPFRPLWVRGKWRVGFLAIRDIAAGEELTWHYSCPPQGHQWLYRHPHMKAQVQSHLSGEVSDGSNPIIVSKSGSKETHAPASGGSVSSL